MTPRELIATAIVPGGEELSLYRRGADFMIVLGRNELMNSRMSGSEEALATMTIERLPGASAPHLLIGGYGMGFTLRAALGALAAGRAADRRRAGARDHRLGARPDGGARRRQPRRSARRNRRARRRGADRAARARYDAILLDVDNGPDGLTRDSNDRLYSMAGLAAARTALRPAGILAIWSAAPDPRFTRRLKSAGFAVEETVVRARSNGKGPRHVIWFARRA